MKRAIIFDFDDTLVYTNEQFEIVKARFTQLMQNWQLADQRLGEVLNAIDVANVKKAGGLAAHCFPQALRQTYLYYCRAYACQPDLQKADQCEKMGWEIFRQQPRLVEGVVELLEAVSPYYELYLLTQGEQEIQSERLQKSGLGAFFKRYQVVKAKKLQHFKQLIDSEQIDVSVSWSVGNSLRSDINPALAAGLQAVHVAIECWDYEQAVPRGGYLEVKDLRACHKVLLEEVT